MTTRISKETYGQYSSTNYGANCMAIRVGNLSLFFSYDTVVAFQSPRTGFVIRQNDWSTTTGKHLNWLDPDKSKRISGTEFEKKLAAVLKHHKLSL